jgi:hypothetical protein
MIAHADEISWEAELAAQQRLSRLRDNIEPAVAVYDGVLDLSTATVAPMGLLSTGPPTRSKSGPASAFLRSTFRVRNRLAACRSAYSSSLRGITMRGCSPALRP